MNPGLGMKWSGLTKGSGRKLKEFHSARSGSLPRWCSRNLVIWENFNASEVQAKGEQYYNAYLEKVVKHQRYHAELGLTDSETDSDEEVPRMVARVQAEGQAGPNPGEHDEG
ncbi:hypothetical protein Tco_0758261 [Tanacetum coccineum]